MSEAYPACEPGADGSQVHYRGRRLYGNPPRQAAEFRGSRIQIPDQTLCLVVSPLLGYGVDAVRHRLPPSSELVLVEADENLLTLTREATDLAVRSVSTLTRDLLGAPDDWFYRFRRVVTISLNGGYALHASTYRSVADIARRRLQRAWQNKITTIHMGRLWIANIITNLPSVVRSRDLSELRTAKPVLVLGAGPSLDMVAGKIEDLRRDLFIIAVDTAYRSLIERGVHPDLVCVVEAQHANLEDILGAPLTDQAVCVDSASYPGIVRRAPANRRYFFSSSFTDSSLFDRLQSAGLRPTAVPALGSVGATAFEVASRITTRGIIVSGLDFAFAHGKTHARGTPQMERALRGISRLAGSDPAPFTLSARVLKAGNNALPLTTSELATYNSVTAELARRVKGIPVFDVGFAPTPIGIRRTPTELATILPQVRGGSRAQTTLQTRFTELADGAPPASRVEAAGGFVDEEVAQIERFIDVLRTGTWAEALVRLEDLSYIAVDFPDPRRLEANTAPRLLAAAAFYRGRWLRTATDLGGNARTSSRQESR